MSTLSVTGPVNDFGAAIRDITGMATKPTRRIPTRLFIEEHLRHAGYSDEQFGAKIGRPRETVFRWRKYQHRLNPDKIAEIAAGLGVRPIDLYHPPGRISLDDLAAGADDETHKMLADIVRRVTGAPKP